VCAGATILAPRVWREGWLSVVPMMIKSAALPFGGDTLRLHIEDQIGVGNNLVSTKTQVSEDQLVGIVNRIHAGIPGARPGSPAWERSYGALWDRLRNVSGVLSAKPDELRLGNRTYGPAAIEAYERMLDLPIDANVVARAVSVAGEPLPIRSTVSHRWPRWFIDDNTLEWTEADGEKKSQGFRLYTTIQPKTASSTGRFSLEGTLTTYASSTRDSSRKEIDRRVVVVSSQLVGSIQRAMTPVSSEALNQLLASTVRFDRLISGRLLPGSAQDPSYDDCAFAMIVEVYDGETQLIRGHARWFGLRGSEVGSVWGRVYEMTSHQRIHSAVEDSRRTLTIKVRSDPISALQIMDAVRYWEGEFSFTSPTPPIAPSAPASNAR
jgi:hypothetical protein